MEWTVLRQKKRGEGPGKRMIFQTAGQTDGSLSVIKNHFFSVTTTAVIFAEDKKRLDENTELFQSLLAHYCTDSEILYFPHLQEAGFLASVPCGIFRHLVSNDVSSAAFLFSE